MRFSQFLKVDVHDVLVGFVVGDNAFELLPSEVDLVGVRFVAQESFLGHGCGGVGGYCYVYTTSHALPWWLVVLGFIPEQVVRSAVVLGYCHHTVLGC
jgi:hypothetical protein